ncbi:nucleoside hydrolase [Streptomyces sp. RFCAC02]|uniref:nucleoside hydrolase n=1 Tax=Streptomyces sp. RFCAC02 TaxID=2499143 RepID=UPI001020A0EA|nr:nucleoside hydrolase [Streptomyces sp. RFCAC02]
MPVPVVIDCDPGHDDAVALMLAAGDPAVDLLAVTTVGGSQTLEKTTLNARRVCSAAGIDVPVAAGCARPLNQPLRIADDMHGISGLDGSSFPEPTVALTGEHAVDLLHRVLTTSPEPVTIIPTAPLTNIAVLLTRYPEVAPAVREIVLMGGSAERGNVTPYAEANIHGDPEAAQIVFSSGLPVTMCGLNVTHQALVTPDVIDRLNALGTGPGRVCAELITYYGRSYQRLWDFPAPPLHDPVAVARVIDPALVGCVDASVEIELRGEHTRGATVVDLHDYLRRPPNAKVATTLDRDGFLERVVDAVARLGDPRPAGQRP